MGKIDWSKTGTRIRRQPPDLFGNCPDWNFAHQRWKDEADYYADELSVDEIVAAAKCPRCEARPGQRCEGFDSFHQPRKRAAGETLLAKHGPRFGG